MEEILIGKKLDHYKMSFSIYTQGGAIFTTWEVAQRQCAPDQCTERAALWQVIFKAFITICELI